MRMMRGLGTAGLLVAFFTGAEVEAATTIDFSGTLNATALVRPDSSCAPAAFRGVISPANTVGLSPLGAFTYGHSVCLVGGAGPVVGTFSVFFATDQFDGTLAGEATAVGDGTFNNAFNYVITGGSGRFAGGTGAFVGTGTVDPRSPPPRLFFSFAPVTPVPEPATWLTMLFGFGLVGAAIRRRPSSANRPILRLAREPSGVA